MILEVAFKLNICCDIRSCIDIINYISRNENIRTVIEIMQTYLGFLLSIPWIDSSKLYNISWAPNLSSAKQTTYTFTVTPKIKENRRVKQKPIHSEVELG